MELNAGRSFGYVTCAQLYRNETIRRARKHSCKPVDDSITTNMILPRLNESKKSFITNFASLFLLIAYSLFGGIVFLYFEEEEYNKRRHNDLNKRYECVDEVIRSKLYDASTALRIIQECNLNEETIEWNFLNSLLYGFGILTTLGYGKIEASTTYGKLFTVFYGFLGVPVTVIILTNFGLYLRHLEKMIRISCISVWHARRKSKMQKKNAIRLNEPNEEEGRISPVFLMITVVVYLVFGAIVMPLLNGHFAFVDGLYYSYICFTAIEFGALIPKNGAFIPIVILYMCVGLAISTMAVELGSIYVKKLYYCGRRATNFATVKIWFGSKQLKVTELLTALSQTIGVSADTFSELDLEQLVKDAILVKEGKLDRIPQGYIFLEGIWPPSLVPLFLRDGTFPDYVDADEKRPGSIRKKSLGFNSARIAATRLAYLRALAEEQEEQEDLEVNNNGLLLTRI